MNINDIHSIYMIGIGGIGMSGLARYFKTRGVKVSGYDKVSTPLTDQLVSEGIPVHFNEDIKALPEDMDLVIYTPAIPPEHKELTYLRAQKKPVAKRSEVLKQITENKFTIAVAGTHGKTTISSLIAHMLHQSGKEINAFIGGIMKNYQSNFIGSTADGIYVTEADEFDKSFLNLFPDVTVISSMDTDHLDIYGNKEDMIRSFRQFAGQLKSGGVLFIHKKLSGNFSVAEDIFTYAFQGPADNYIDDFKIENGHFILNMVLFGTRIDGISFNIPGRHNVENAVAAASVCKELGISEGKIRSGLESYKGVMRRFDTRVKLKNLVYIDDYAHHPEEIKSCISAARDFYPGKKVTGVFQPHLFSRTRDLAAEFAESLDMLDEVMLLDIYPAREKPLEGINSGLILDMMKHTSKKLVSKKELLALLEKKELEVLLTMGAGDIDQLVPAIENILKGKRK